MLADFHEVKLKAEKITGDWRLRVHNFVHDEATGIYTADVDSMSDAGITYAPTMSKASEIELNLNCQCDGFAAKNICWHCIALVRTVLESKSKTAPTAKEEPAPKAEVAAAIEADLEEEARTIEPEVMNEEEIIPEDEVSRIQQLVPVTHNTEVVNYADAPSPKMAIAEFRARTGMIDELHKELIDGTDYGRVDGIAKPFLHQPGAEKLQIGFNVVPLYTIVEQEVDHERLVPLSKYWKKMDPQPKKAPANYKTKDGVKGLKEQGKMKCVPSGPEGAKVFTWYEAVEEEGGMSIGFYRFVIKCELHSRSNGAFVGEAMAVCSSLETKYIRNARNAENTILQMAQKRASVRATRTALGLSDRFTQDPDIVRNQGQ